MLDRGFWVASFFISAFENILSVSSYLYGFWWEILCHSNGFHPPCKMSFFCGCFQEFFLVCFNQKLNYVVFAYRFISISYLRFTQLFENIDISLDKFGEFSATLPSSFFSSDLFLFSFKPVMKWMLDLCKNFTGPWRYIYLFQSIFYSCSN